MYSIPHRRRSRNIQPHQKIHISAGLYGYADEDKRTIANLPQADTINWRQLCALVADQRALSSVEELPRLRSNVSQPVRTLMQRTSESLHGSRRPPTIQERRRPIALQSNGPSKKYLSKFELDWLDYGISSTLINGVKHGSNVVEFFERLNLIAHSGTLTLL